MFRPLWFHKLLGLRSRSVRRRQAAQNRRYVRPHLEELEERVTPDGLPFPTAANGSELQQNITFINGNTNQAWSFKLQANTTFNLTAQQELTNGANVTIVGQGGDVITPAAGIRALKVDAAFSGRIGMRFLRQHNFDFDVFAIGYLPLTNAQDVDSPLPKSYTPSLQLGLGIGF